MSNSYGFGGDDMQRESSWRYPLAVFLATLVLCVIFLYYYFGPGVDEFSGNSPSPTISEEPIKLKVGGKTFSAPANYTIYPRDRSGGQREDVSLFALWPTMTGYTPSHRAEFVENAEDTRRIDILIARRTSAFLEAERIEALYLPQTVDKRGISTPYQLRKYLFRDQRANVPTSGYASTELFLGESADGGLMALFCFKDSDDIPSPECWREYEMTDGVSVSYRFKRPFLPEWQAIDARVRQFIIDLDERVDD